MAKRNLGKEVIVKLIVGAGQASPSPPVGPALGSKGVKSMDFCKVCPHFPPLSTGPCSLILLTFFSPPLEPLLPLHPANPRAQEFNALTASFTPGTPIPALITVRPDRTFHFTLRTPPTSTLLLSAAGVSPSKGQRLRGANAPGRATSETSNTSDPAFRVPALAAHSRTSSGGGSIQGVVNKAPSISANAGKEVGKGVVKLVAKSAGGDKDVGAGGGSAQVGEVSLKHVYEIARIKQSEERLKGMSLEGLVRSVVGQARSVGVGIVP
jgi:large subunit ribosomal protein L11